MFRKILIANRGEIACRIIRTARRMGVRTVAVYSEADRDAMHVAMADEALAIGPALARDSYLKSEAIIAAARKSGADAIHPGYGFLSENAAFAEDCEAVSLTFIGPPARAIRAMGSKSAAKALMERAGVPVVPGYHGEAQDHPTLAMQAERIGYPVLVKASSGGGGKGMRVVERAEQLEESVAAAKREARAAFGSDRVLIERYVDRPRHIEMQVFADRYGNVVHLFERECSLQRRHQKVIEEAPSTVLSKQQRYEMGEKAAAAAKAVGYVGAGTVEFLYDRSGNYYFMEMNTRLQVEHPVTEYITGLDLVQWQIEVASGHSLPLQQQDVQFQGHAIEARLYAEDPARDFLPATGKLMRLRLPEPDKQTRIETGVREGDAISIHYDPMIAKIIVWAEDRSAAVRQMQAVLAATEVAGVTTNLPFLSALARHWSFTTGDIDTGTIARYRDELAPADGAVTDRMLALASLAAMLSIGQERASQAERSEDRWSPFHANDLWLLNGDGVQTFEWRSARSTDDWVAVNVRMQAGRFTLYLPGGRMSARANLAANGTVTVELDEQRIAAAVLRQGHLWQITDQATTANLVLRDLFAEADLAEAGEGHLTAPMPGKVVAVRVKVGDAVTRGQPLVTLEAMKMEHTIVAPSDGVIEAIRHAAGEQVPEGAELVAVRAKES
jgi:3-methylcrotonyl-CoA carboxylase alpha subunit